VAGDAESGCGAGCGAYNNKGGSCHTFFDEIGDLLTKKQVRPSAHYSSLV
jgi:hypothetical protein